MKISVFGCGYVGLVTAAGLASLGHKVIGIDTDYDKIHRLVHGQIPIYEPGLEPIVRENLKNGRLTFTNDSKIAAEESVAIFITVGTPPKEDGSADLSQVEEVARTIALHMNGFKAIIDKSTVPVGTARFVHQIIQASQSNFEFCVVSNPEFLREGCAVEDFLRPDRIVVGFESEKAKAIMSEMYQHFIHEKTPIIWTNLETAELIKYASNGFLATKITYINELTYLCEAVNADVLQVAEGMGSDRRIGPDFLKPGPGYGGSCFPKDTRALLSTAADHGLRLSIIDATVTANNEHKLRMAEKIHRVLGDIQGKNIAVLGLAFKANTDDMRESPAIPIINELIQSGAKIIAHDPAALKEAKTLFGSAIQYVNNPEDAIKGADAIVILTEWDQYRSMDFEHINKLMNNKVLIDLRNMINPNKALQAGFHYEGIGRIQGS
jgi:UDPglucose 6-dehydrogenase